MLRCVWIWYKDRLQPVQYAGLAGCCARGDLSHGCWGHLRIWLHYCTKDAHHSSLGGSSSGYGSLSRDCCGRIRGARCWLWGGGWTRRQDAQQDIDRGTLTGQVAQIVESNYPYVICAQWSDGVIPEATIPFEIQW